jgi:ribose transport system substrate-binding protein
MNKRSRVMKKSKHHRMIISGIALLFMILVMVGSMLVFKLEISDTTSIFSKEASKLYDNYYVMIVDDVNSSFWKSVYEKARQIGEENSTYVELMGNELATNYSKTDLLRIAIESSVDGIFLEADESSDMTKLINEAVEKDIPVITVIGDNTASKRQSFVGISSYNLGREYGSQVLSLYKREVMKVLILMTAQARDSGQNIIYSGLQEMIEASGKRDQIHIESIAIDNTSSFAAEETIRDIFMESIELPDILICLDELNTTCAYQAIVDYNKVGEVNIIGYYDSADILNAIRKKVVHSTISVNTEQIGEYMMEAIMEYQSVGQVNEYYTVDTALITLENIGDYYGNEKNE